MIKTVGIIGAGFAGLSTAKVLKACGFEVTVFEKEPDVGGVWAASRRYPGLTTQNPRTTYALSDFPMPEDYPEWPSGEQVQRYLHAYAEHFGLLPAIRLDTMVNATTLDEQQNRWTVQVTSNHTGADSAEREHQFDFLVVCNGIFSEPAIPHWEASEMFRTAGGRICHTSQFTDAEDARGKHVLVIGYGKSSCDVANAIAERSASTTLVARNLIWKIPKKFLNILNFKFLMLTRMGEALFKYIEVKGFEKFLHGGGKPLRNAMMALVQSIVTIQLKLRHNGLHPGKPLETIASGTVSLVTDGFYEKVASGGLRVKANASIRRFVGRQAVLSTGELLPVDIVICGTGWRQQVPFFSEDLMARITDNTGNFRLYRSILPTHVPRLAFNGYNSSFFSQLNCEIGALWLANYLRGGFSPPPVSVMDALIDQRLAWMVERTSGKHSRGTNITPFSMHNIDELLQDMQLQIGASKRLKQWFGPVNPSDYREVTRRLLARHAVNADAQHGVEEHIESLRFKQLRNP